jgi:hypothetical protein
MIGARSCWPVRPEFHRRNRPDLILIMLFTLSLPTEQVSRNLDVGFETQFCWGRELLRLKKIRDQLRGLVLKEEPLRQSRCTGSA